VDDIDKKVKEVLEGFGKVKREGSGTWKVKNEMKPSFHVKISDGNPKKIVNVSPVFSKGVRKDEWSLVAKAQAKAIQRKVEKIFPKVL